MVSLALIKKQRNLQVSERVQFQEILLHNYIATGSTGTRRLSRASE